MSNHNCSHCGSEKTIWHSKGLNRRICKSCRKTFIIGTDDGENTKARADKIDGLSDQVKDLKKEAEREKYDRRAAEKLLEITLGISDAKKPAKPWVRKKPKQAAKNSIATAFLSDTHFDETVNGEEISYVNEYNREIATRRLQRFFERTLMLTFDFVSGIDVPGLVLAMGGDMVSGNIHEELRCTNSAPIMDTIIYWSEQLESGIRTLAKEFKNIHIPCVTGNHGRNTHKPIHKGRTRDNFDWLLYKLLQRATQDLTHVTWDVSNSTEARWDIHGVRYHMTHGDQFKGGTGISGIASPIFLGAHRKQKRETGCGTPFDIMLIGHFHQYRDFGDVLINGSLKGYDEFAASKNFSFEKPTQAWWLTNQKYGKTISAPIYVDE